MPKLYYTATSCGASCFISAYVAGVSLECETVDLREKKAASGKDFLEVNEKGNVPCLVLDDGSKLIEGAAVHQWIADHKTAGGDDIAGEYGSLKRYEVQSMLNYVASEIHATCGHLFNPVCTGEAREYITGAYKKKLQRVNDVVLKDKKFLVGDSFTCADAYLYIVLTWCPYIGIDLSEYPAAKAYMEHIASLPKVSEAIARINSPDGGPTTTC